MGYKLLLADDSITIQKVVGIIFANEDYELTVVDNGNDALEKARQIVPDVILVDALMPGKSGYEVCREIRQDPAISNIPLLLLVGAFEPFDEEKARNSGADDHVSKPFESQYLIDKVKKLIKLREERAGAVAPSVVEMPAVSSAENPDIGSAISSGMEAPAETTAEVTAGRPDVGASTDVLYLDSLEIVEASPEDDLWGAFEVEEITEDEEVRLGEVVEEDDIPSDIIDTVEEIEPFAYKEVETNPYANENIISLGEYPEEVPESESEADQEFVFSEEPEFADEEVSSTDDSVMGNVGIAGITASEYASEASLTISDFVDTMRSPAQTVDVVPSPDAQFQQAEQDLLSSPEEELVSSPDILSSEAGIQEVEASETVSSDSFRISEAQLASIISTVSRELIEKIAWEVVPDLAETIIREEIRKIKEGY
jgi:CheY-like chemotaxis protein